MVKAGVWVRMLGDGVGKPSTHYEFRINSKKPNKDVTTRVFKIMSRR